MKYLQQQAALERQQTALEVAQHRIKWLEQQLSKARRLADAHAFANRQIVDEYEARLAKHTEHKETDARPISS